MAATRSKTKAQVVEKPTVHYEFGGPVGALGIIVSLPAVCYGLVFFCNADVCIRLNNLTATLPALPAGMVLFSWQACAVYLGWMAYTTLLHLLLPGIRKEGILLPDNTRLTYKLNGMRCFLVTMCLVGAGVYSGNLDLGWVHANFLALLTAAIIFSNTLSVCLYAGSFVGNKTLAKGGDSGNWVYDFFIGRELNPRIGGFDLKVFCELVPGLIGWLLLDLGFAQRQFQTTGAVSPAMGLVCAFQALYVVDALWFETAILTTMDVTTDGFGFMLAFGDLVWVPFTYSLQARYILEHPKELEGWFLALILAIKVAGYVVFRGSNLEKNWFRNNPDDPRVKHLRYLPTERGTRLIVSGWWGVARHVNYLGDWLMAWAWCLPCGVDDIVPYFYVIYFGILLVHRDLRDGEACKEKYGKDWDKYTALVPYRLIPYVY
eukprot:CAMPEP_0181374646 /NCGR_PEP_ID=MMETSP1106-20121128/16147_1 /TAXON_ID=81844 /ORGANISM="Mantoniella antarctica, Strain SL-175" /LENGTH=431 /DNA_ID=CAMNT_0023492673 /DNA_START=92 /DNA_END=1387 /DNA_ORIENTATION=+